MVTAISKANFEIACGNCYDYILAQDWGNAYLYFAAAEAQLAGLEVQGGHGNAYFRLHDSLDKLGKAIEMAQSGFAKSNQGSRLMRIGTKYQ